MTTVASVFGHNMPRRQPAPHAKLAFNALCGVELEIENCTYVEAPLWDCKEDGSLRNGCELVCARPYGGEELYQAIENLATGVGASTAEGTWRCSTHVHIDVRDLEAPVLKKMILAYAFYEKMLFKCSGFHRYRSNFCPAFAVVQQQIMNVSAAFNYNGERFFGALIRGWDKYTSMNLLPLRDFGSVEFRISEPKWKRTNVLNLVNRYLVLKKLAVENASMSNQQFVEFLRTQAFEPMIHYLPLDYTPDPEDLSLGWQVANDIIAIRANGVEVVQRIRESAMGADGSELIDTQQMGHWDAYWHYVLANHEQWFDENIRELLPNGRRYTRSGEMTRRQIEHICDLLENARGSDGRVLESNLTRLIPSGFRNDIETFLNNN